MTASIILMALGWGVLAGYLLLRGSDSLIGLTFCLHGLFAQRWKRLADKNATGLIRPRLFIKLAARLACYLLLCWGLLEVSHDFMRREFSFRYGGPEGLFAAAAAGLLILSRVSTSWRRMRLVWRLTHEFDFAARRERTQLLKG